MFHMKKVKCVCLCACVCECVCTWMRLAAGFLLFSKCFCRCCSWTLRAKPEPKMPYKKDTHTCVRTQKILVVIISCAPVSRDDVTRGGSLQAGRRRRSPAERSRPTTSAPSTSAESCRRNRSWSG